MNWINRRVVCLACWRCCLINCDILYYLSRHYGAVVEDLVAILLGTDPAKRPSAEQIITVPALQSYVKSTYRKCMRHKQGLMQAASVAKQCISSNHPAPVSLERVCLCIYLFISLYMCLWIMIQKIKEICHKNKNAVFIVIK